MTQTRHYSFMPCLGSAGNISKKLVRNLQQKPWIQCPNCSMSTTKKNLLRIIIIATGIIIKEATAIAAIQSLMTLDLATMAHILGKSVLTRRMVKTITHKITILETNRGNCSNNSQNNRKGDKHNHDDQFTSSPNGGNNNNNNNNNDNAHSTNNTPATSSNEADQSPYDSYCAVEVASNSSPSTNPIPKTKAYVKSFCDTGYDHIFYRFYSTPEKPTLASLIQHFLHFGKSRHLNLLIK